MSDLVLHIISELMSHPEPMSSEQLAILCNVSSKTVQRCISNMKQHCVEHGFVLSSKTGKGTTCKIIDEDKFRKYLFQMQREPDMNTPENRKKAILRHLLLQEGEVKLSDLSEELYVSLSQINIDMKEIKQLLSNHHLTIATKPGKGIYICGLEKDKRECIAQYCFQNQNAPNMFHDQIVYQGTLHHMIEETITPVFLQQNMHISDIAAKSLAIHLIIAVERVKNQKLIGMSEEAMEELLQKTEYSMAQQIAYKAGSMFQIHFPQPEICYITQHILGKRNFETNGNEPIQLEQNPQMNRLVNQMLRAIFDQTKIDFFYDRDLKNNLMLHFIPFVHRMKHHLSIHNPILEEIKQKYSFAFELATIGLSVIGKELEASISEDEIGYFALHFILALDRQKESDIQANILIICSSGRATSQLIAYQIKKRFSFGVNTIKIIEYYMLDSIDFQFYDYAFSTIPIDKQLPIPVIQINDLLDIEDFQLIERTLFSKRKRINLTQIIRRDLFFLDIEEDNREDVLRYMIRQIKKNIPLPENFLKLVLEREKFSSTDLVSGVAIPHPNKPVSNETFVAVGITRHPFLWEKKQVQLIFLISVSSAQQNTISEFFELLSEFMMQKSQLRQFLKNPTYDHLISLMS